MTISIFPMIFVMVGIASAVTVFIDLFVLGNRQTMRVMSWVWVLAALWSGAVGVLAYFTFGRKKNKTMSMDMPMPVDMKMMHNTKPQWQSVALSTLHCGAGCAVANLVGEWFILFFPMTILSGWALDYLLALTIGVMFQYVVISSMDKIKGFSAFWKALKVDFWSLSAWQVGMYGFMAIAIWGFGVELHRLSWQFWSLMQFAMVCGFLTSYPVNRILIKRGIKMGMN